MKLLAQTFVLTFAFMLVTYGASAIINGGFTLPPPIPKGSPIPGHPSYPSAAGGRKVPKAQYFWVSGNKFTVYWTDSKKGFQLRPNVAGGTAWAFIMGTGPAPK